MAHDVGSSADSYSLTYMVLGLLAIGGIYMYRFTVWAAQAGGYWNLITGHRPNPAAVQAQSAMKKAAEVAGQAAQSGAAKVGKVGKVSFKFHPLFAPCTCTSRGFVWASRQRRKS